MTLYNNCSLFSLLPPFFVSLILKQSNISKYGYANIYKQKDKQLFTLALYKVKIKPKKKKIEIVAISLQKKRKKNL